MKKNEFTQKDNDKEVNLTTNEEDYPKEDYLEKEDVTDTSSDGDEYLREDEYQGEEDYPEEDEYQSEDEYSEEDEYQEEDEYPEGEDEDSDEEDDERVSSNRWNKMRETKAIPDSEEVRRERRHRRRIRNQIISYLSLVLVLALLGAGIFFAVHRVVKTASDKKQEQELAAQLDALASSEEEIVVAEPETEETVQTDPLDEIADACIAEMPLEDKVAGLFFVTPEELTGATGVTKAGDATQAALGQYAVGGIIYFENNIKNADQITEMLTNTVKMSKYPIFLGVDEEGGSVSRVAKSGIDVTKVGDMSEIGASGDTAKALEAGTTIGTYLAKLGFNLDFAPVADVAGSEDTVIGKRSFGADAAVVGNMVGQFTTGLMSSNVSACLKHFPGIGGTDGDTHDGMAATNRTLEEMQSSEFTAFQAGITAGAEFVMVSHISAPNILTDNTPCSLSSDIIQNTLRNQLGYNGIVITDAMNMTAITDYYTPDEAAIKAINAGADMILMPEDFKTAYDGVLAAVQSGTISEDRINESLHRIYRVKYKNSDALTAE